MKVYVNKDKDGKYITDSYERLYDLRFAEMFNDYDCAICYCPTDCEVVEVQLMETTELADYTKKVRKEVVKEIKQKLVQMGRWDIQENGSIYFKMNINTLNDILDKFEQEE